MRATDISGAVAVVAAERFGHRSVLDQLIDEVGAADHGAALAGQLGEFTATVQGVALALSGGSATPRLVDPVPVEGLAQLAMLTVRCASTGDRAGVQVICREADQRGQLRTLLTRLTGEANRALDDLDRLPGPGSAVVLARLGLAAARRNAT